MARRTVRWLPGLALLILGAALVLHGPIAQPASYHAFADTRAWLGIPRAADVLSNAAFLVAGVYGLLILRGQPSAARATIAYRAFFACVALTAFGSAYYHLAPDNDRLVWDRLPIALACVALISAVHAQTHARQPRALLPLLMALGAASVLWWWATERAGVGDLRPYLLLQAAPLVLVPAWQWIAGAAPRERAMFGIAIALYALAKLAELGDRLVLDTLGAMSGHTLKHLLAALAACAIAVGLPRRGGRASM